MQTHTRSTFLAQSLSATVSGLLAVLTAVWPDWVEALTGLNPDGGSGYLEWVIAASFAAAAVLFGALARREWQKLSIARAM